MRILHAKDSYILVDVSVIPTSGFKDNTEITYQTLARLVSPLKSPSERFNQALGVLIEEYAKQLKAEAGVIEMKKTIPA